MRNVVLASVATVALLGWQANGLAAQSGQAATKGTKAQATKAPSGASDEAFAKEAASGGMMEVELGRMASNQASHDDVKKFGQRMVDDHSKANNDLNALAQRKNITLPSTMAKNNQATRDHLAKLNGAAFDQAYMQHMVADHAKDVRAFEHEAKMGKDPDIKAWAEQLLPTLQDHLKQAKEVSATVNGGHPGKPTKGGKKQ